MRTFRWIAVVAAVVLWGLLAWHSGSTDDDASWLLDEARALVESRGLEQIVMTRLPVETDAPRCTGQLRQGFEAVAPEYLVAGTDTPMNVIGNVCCDANRQCEVVIDWSKSSGLNPFVPPPGAFAHTLEDYFGPNYMALGRFSDREACERDCKGPNRCHSPPLSKRETICIKSCSSDRDCPPATRCSCQDPRDCGGGAARLVRPWKPYGCAWARGLVPDELPTHR